MTEEGSVSTTAFRLLVADDQLLVRAGIVMLLSAQPDMEVVAEASDGAEAVALARSHAVDLVVMDLQMPVLDGVAATRALTADGPADEPPLRVLALTTFDDDEAVYGALRAGAGGYVLKHAAPSDLVAAVRHVMAGDTWLDPSVAGRVVDALRRTDPLGDDPDGLVARLTAREREILGYMAHGETNADIAARLVLSAATVRTHVNRILVKTASATRTQAVVLAYRSGLVRVHR